MQRKFELPFKHLSITYTVTMILVIVILPFLVLVYNVATLSLAEIFTIVSDTRFLNALRLTFLTAFKAATINIFIGFIIAWALERYKFWGKGIVDAFIDIPFALPTSIAGVAITYLYSDRGFLGAILAKFHIKAVYNELGIIIALVFVGLPFVVRTIQPVISELDKDVEIAASFLGASKVQIFIKITFKIIAPALVSAFILAFARGIGEFGSVVFIAGNIPNLTETLSLLLYIKIEQYNFKEASLIAFVSLMLSFFIVIALTIYQKRAIKHVR